MWLCESVQVLLHMANQYIHAYTEVATSASAHGMQAAGIQVGLPAEVGRLLAFLQQLARALGKQAVLTKCLPPFLLDNWQCLITTEKGW